MSYADTFYGCDHCEPANSDIVAYSDHGIEALMRILSNSRNPTVAANANAVTKA
jgi:hypothetical protein